jgi:hypothetical protein
MMDAKEIEHRAIYIGKHEGASGGFFHFYRLLGDTPNNGESTEGKGLRDVGFKKPVGYASIGLVIRFRENKGENSSTWNNLGSIERWKCEEEVMKWQAQVRTLETIARNKNEATKNKYKEVEENIDSLSNVYRKLPAIQRDAFLAWVVSGVVRRAHREK